MNCDTPPAEPEGYRFVRRRGAGTFRSPERPAFANSGKSGQKRRQKPSVFGFSTGRFRCGWKRSRRESATGLPSLPLTWWAGDLRVYHLGRLSNRALAAFCGKCRCGPSGRRIQNYVGCKALPLYGAREESFRAVRGSGSGDRSAGDPVRNLFAPQLQLDEREIQKPMVFGGVLFHISFAVERNMATGGINAGRGCNPQSENGKRAVGNAGPYGVRDRRHDEIRVDGVCPLGAFKRGTRERVAFSGGL